MTFARWDDLEFFTKDEFDCKCGCGENEMKHSFMLQLDVFRRLCGFPFPVTSGYRCPEHNNNESSTGRDGPHTTGKAVDIAVYGKEAHAVLMLAHKELITGIGVKQNGSASKRFIHLDTLNAAPGRPRPWVWTY